MMQSLLGLLWNSFIPPDYVKVSDDPPNIRDFIEPPLVKKEFDGIVTSVEVDSGVINNSIYYTVKRHWPTLTVGCKVSGIAERRNQNESWRVRDLWIDDVPCQENQADELILVPKVIIDQVTSIRGVQMTTKSGYTFIVSVCQAESLECGDWLQIKTTVESGKVAMKSSSLEVTSIVPNRTKTVKGQITHMNRKSFIVNNDIFCDMNICSDVPYMNMKVVATVVESDQNGYSWRATCWLNDEADRNQESYCLKEQNKFNLRIQVITATELLKCLNLPELNITTNKDIKISVPQSITFTSVGACEVLQLVIRNEGFRNAQVLNILFVSDERVLTLNPNSYVQSKLPAVIKRNGTLSLPIVCTGHHSGKIDVIVRINEELYQEAMTVSIAKLLYHPNNFSYGDNNQDTVVIPGQRRRAPRFNQKFLPDCHPPNFVRDSAFSAMGRAPQVLKENLNFINYVEKLSLLLHYEEVYLEKQLRKYTLEHMTFSTEGEFLAVLVEGLSEKRPSVIPGDIILVTPMYNIRNKVKYEGSIHQIIEKKILVKFSASFHNNYKGEECVIEFKLNRVPMKKCHRAIRTVSENIGKQFLFPVRATNHVVINKSDLNGIIDKIKFINPLLNYEQKCAVAHVTQTSCTSLPYIIYGPPGTGKTITLVECILQSYKQNSSARILITTPSNSACDLLMQRILQWDIIDDGSMARVLGFNRELRFVSPELQPYCYYGKDIETAIRHRLVLCTSSMSGQLLTSSIKPGHFSHLFFDEAGQLTEPESCVPLSLIDITQCQVVLAGDPKQLGPVIMSPIAKKFGLGESFLQRLCNSVIYQPTYKSDCVEYDAQLVTRLIRNYRSHNDIITIPSQLFYSSSLIASCDTKVSESLLKFPLLPNKKCPIIFHGVLGENEQNGSTSWFNLEEAQLAAEYYNAVSRFGIDDSDIGVITPYRKQVQKIRKALGIYHIDDRAKIASVEEFQGQERKVIILSTVRSAEDFVEENVTYNLGFLKSPERFNVSITRAQYLLIVIGNPFVLQCDTNWKAFLTFCVQNKAYTGVPLATKSQ